MEMIVEIGKTRNVDKELMKLHGRELRRNQEKKINSMEKNPKSLFS